VVKCVQMIFSDWHYKEKPYLRLLSEKKIYLNYIRKKGIYQYQKIKVVGIALKEIMAIYVLSKINNKKAEMNN